MDSLPIIPFFIVLAAYLFGAWRGFKWGRRATLGVAQHFLVDAKKNLREAQNTLAQAEELQEQVDALLAEVKKTIHDGKNVTAKA